MRKANGVDVGVDVEETAGVAPEEVGISSSI